MGLAFRSHLTKLSHLRDYSWRWMIGLATLQLRGLAHPFEDPGGLRRSGTGIATGRGLRQLHCVHKV